MEKYLRAFTNTPVTKPQVIEMLLQHKAADAIIQKQYGDNESMQLKGFSGCAVGCTIHSIKLLLGEAHLKVDNHQLYEKYLGIPEWLALLEDRIFEMLPQKCAKNWPLEFTQAINDGAELDKVKPLFLIFILQDIDRTNLPENICLILNRVIAIWQRTDIYSDDWNKEASEAAWAASAASAAWAARVARAARATSEAAWAAKVASAARATSEAAWAARATWAARVAWAASEASATKAELYAGKLLELLKCQK